MDYQQEVNSLTGAMGPKQGAYPNYANAGNLDNNPFVDLSSQPLEYRSYVSHDGNIGYVPAYMFGRRSGRKSKTIKSKGRKGRKSRKVRKPTKRRSGRKASRKGRKGRKSGRKSARKSKASKSKGHKFGCDSCGSKSGFGSCSCNSDKEESNGFGSVNMCGSVCGA